MVCGVFGVIVPPAPALGVKVYVFNVKMALGDEAEFIVKTHVPVPKHTPSNQIKVEPASGVAVSVTTFPALYVAAQVAPQFIPPASLVTVPVPVPDLVTVSV